MGGMRRMVILFSVLAVTGCYRYEPRVNADRAAPQYQSDLAACQESSVDAVNKHNAKRGLDWFGSPVRRPFQIREAIRSCVKAKGYAVAG